jgi:hypothetical protein
MGWIEVPGGPLLMNDRLGQKVKGGLVASDVIDPSVFLCFEGVPKQRVDIVRQGVVEGPVYDRKTARKDNTTSTGHAPPPDFRSHGPLAANLFMAAGEANLEELIRSTENGLYISRFWYTRCFRLCHRHARDRYYDPGWLAPLRICTSTSMFKHGQSKPLANSLLRS